MMRGALIISLLAVGVVMCAAQTEGKSGQGTQDKKLDQLPFPVGGIEAIGKVLKYPETARKDSVQGIVFVEATVDQEGKVVKAIASKGVREDLDKAAVDAVKSVTFTPGIYEGKAVESIVTIPISFKLK